MSPVRQKRVIAIACSDIHLSLKPPVARSGEEDWFKAMARPLHQLNDMAQAYDAPILCAGDVFDRWNSPPELINWALNHLPNGMITIPGQHDLPLHNLDHIQKSAYHTLTKAGKIVDMGGTYKDGTYGYKNLVIQGFPWGVPLKPCERLDDRIHVALIHQYAWMTGHSYPGALEEAHWDKITEGAGDWDVIIFGDNHKGFLAERQGTVVLNCGTLMRRKSDEIDYNPMVGLIYEDGDVKIHNLDTTADIIQATEPKKTEEEDQEIRYFLNRLAELRESRLDFVEAMHHILDERKPPKRVREIILEAMET